MICTASSPIGRSIFDVSSAVLFLVSSSMKLLYAPKCQPAKLFMRFIFILPSRALARK